MVGPLVNNIMKPVLTKNIIKIFSDELGKNMGVALNDLCLGQSVINYCMPGASCTLILNKILNVTHCPNTTIIIMIGRRGNADIRDIKYQINQLLTLQVKKIIMFAFPFIQSMPAENKMRHSINDFMQTIS
ncbi:hypothetical protein F3G63_35590, partial [Pseudomonas aeruginosa]